MYNVQEIKRFIHEREKGRLKIYEEVLEKCFHKIQNAVIRDEPFALFIVPEIILGKPRYNFSNCLQYIIFRLKQNGFEIHYYYPNALKISWGVKDFKTFLSIEKDKGTFDSLAIENKPNTGPSLFDLKIPHQGENIGLHYQKKPKIKKTIDLFQENEKNEKDNFSFKFKDPNKIDKQQKKEEEKYKAIHEFIPKKNVLPDFKSIKSFNDNKSFKRLNFF